MAVPVHRRPYAVFLSHAHADVGFVEALHTWLHDVAGIEVWLDSRHLDGGTSIRGGLTSGIEQCRGMLILATTEALEKGWVEFEVDVAMDERARSRGEFRVIALRVDGAPVDQLIRGLSWIDVEATTLDVKTASAILRALYPADRYRDPRTSRDLYVSASWRAEDSQSAVAVSKQLRREGLRLVGDSKDQKGFRADRIKTIIESCGAFVCVLPFRNGESIALSSGGAYKYFVRELELALAAGLPCAVVADDRVTLGTSYPSLPLVTMRQDESSCSVEVCDLLSHLANNWRSPPNPQYVFLSLSLDSPHAASTHPIRELIERVTGMRTIVGTDVREPPIDLGILESIRKSHLLIADLVGPSDDGFNLDVCIEVGMARATGVSYELFARGPQRRPPFMLGRPQLQAYQSEVELLGKIHEVVRAYRRRLIDAELPP